MSLTLCEVRWRSLRYVEPAEEGARVAVEAACRAARRTLPIWERAHPGNPLPRQAVESAEAAARPDATVSAWGDANRVAAWVGATAVSDNAGALAAAMAAAWAAFAAWGLHVRSPSAVDAVTAARYAGEYARQASPAECDAQCADLDELLSR